MLWNQAAGSISLELIGSWRAGILEDDDHGLLEFELELLKEQVAKEKGRFGDRRCDLTVIGDQSKVDRFTEALKECFLTEEEIKLPMDQMMTDIEHTINYEPKKPKKDEKS